MGSKQRIINFIKIGKGKLFPADIKLLNKMIGTKGKPTKAKNRNAPRVRRFLRTAK